MYLKVLLQQIVLQWACLHNTIAMSHVHWTFKSCNLILKFVFLFKSFVVITRTREIFVVSNLFQIISLPEMSHVTFSEVVKNVKQIKTYGT